MNNENTFHSLPKLRSIVSLFFLLFVFTFIHGQSSFSLEDIFIGQRFSPKSLNIFQILDGETYLTNTLHNKTTIVWKQHFSDNSKLKIFDSDLLREKLKAENVLVTSFTYLADSVYLVGTEKEQIYRHSFQSKYYFVDLKKGIFLRLAKGEKIMYPTLAPDGKQIAYIKENNIYIFDLSSRKEKPVTQDGLKNHIINGMGDWANEEEFYLTSAMWWSDDSKSLAYLKFDESSIKEFSIDYYKNDYPESFKYKYPRAGEEVSKVSAWIYQGRKKQIQVPIETTYIPKVQWKNNSELTFLTINRLQNKLEVVNYNIQKLKLSTWYSEEDKRFIDIPQFFRILPDGELAISSERNGFNHLYFVDKKNNILQVTDGQFSIEEVCRVDLDDSLIVFTAHLPHPENKSILIWDMRTKSLQYLSETNGVANATMLGKGKYMEQFSNQVTRSKISIKSLKDNTSITLVNDQREADTVLLRKEFFWLPVDGYVLRAYRILPADFDSTQKFPVIFYVYGGPGAQTVQDKWDGNIQLWLNYLAHQGFIVYSVDNRGAGGRDADFKKIIYGKLSSLEVEDQLKAIRYVNSLPYVDSSRIAMFGWSYGGYMTLKSMTSDTLIQKGISIAPVTDWRFYDAIYTERYMRTPLGNPSGYKSSSILENAGNLSGDLLLIHGTADDNVHFQNSLELIKKLNAEGEKYRFMPFPNGKHGIGSSKVLYEMFRRITDFLQE